MICMHNAEWESGLVRTWGTGRGIPSTYRRRDNSVMCAEHVVSALKCGIDFFFFINSGNFNELTGASMHISVSLGNV